MKTITKHIIFASVALVGSISIANAAVETTYITSPGDWSWYGDLDGLDHGEFYVWNIDVTSAGLDQAGVSIESASIEFSSIYNNHGGWYYDLWVNLLDGAPNKLGWDDYDDKSSWSGVQNNAFTEQEQINDFGEAKEIAHYSGWQTGNDSSGDPIIEKEIQINERTTVKYEFNDTERGWLLDLAKDGTFGLGVDSDCHFPNKGITLSFTTTSSGSQVPEPSTMLLFGTGIAGLAGVARRKRK